jgi:hypothetical protein
MPAKKFETVKLLKVYLEDTEFERLSDLAKRAGRTLTGFARDILVRECSEGRPNQPVRDTPPIRVDRGRTGSPERPAEPAPKSSAAYSVDGEVSRRTGHPLGCECFTCSQSRRFLENSAKPKAPEKKGRKRK